MTDITPKTITRFDHPESIVVTRHAKTGDQIYSGYGKVTYQDWCDKEIARLLAKGETKVQIVTNSGGLIALSRTPLVSN